MVSAASSHLGVCSEADKLRTLRTLDSMSVTLDRLRHTSIGESLGAQRSAERSVYTSPHPGISAVCPSPGKVVARMAKSDASSTVRDVAQRLKGKAGLQRLPTR